MSILADGQRGTTRREFELEHWRLVRQRSWRSKRAYIFAPTQWIVRTLRDWRYRIRVALTLPKLEDVQSEQLRRAQEDRERLAHEYSQGYMAGWRECFDACLQAVEHEFASVDDVWRMGGALTGSRTIQRDN
jgi:hypothetical protein